MLYSCLYLNVRVLPMMEYVISPLPLVAGSSASVATTVATTLAPAASASDTSLPLNNKQTNK